MSLSDRGIEHVGRASSTALSFLTFTATVHVTTSHTIGRIRANGRIDTNGTGRILLQTFAHVRFAQRPMNFSAAGYSECVQRIICASVNDSVNRNVRNDRNDQGWRIGRLSVPRSVPDGPAGIASSSSRLERDADIVTGQRVAQTRSQELATRVL